jgi:polysaccharide pyruvyl transferase WcaK-like protein
MPIIGLNPLGFCDPRIWPRKDKALYQAYLEKIADFSTWLLEQGYILRMFTTEMSVDRYALEDLEARLRSKLSSPDLLCDVFQPARESVKGVLEQMSGFDFIVTSKLHGVIFSHVLMKPVISLSYHKKMDVAMRAVGQGRFCADIEHFDLTWLKNAFCSLVDERSTIESGFAAAVETNAAKLSQQFDSLFPPDNSLLRPDFPSLRSPKNLEEAGVPVSREVDALHSS